MKKILLLLSLSLLLMLTLCSCATTQTFGYIDPEYGIDYKISKIVVCFEGIALNETFELEEIMVKKLSSYNVVPIKYTSIIPPTRDYSEQERIAKIKETGADSLLLIKVSKDTVKGYVPQTYTPGTTTTKVDRAGNVRTTTTTGYSTGGYSTTSPITTTVSSLISLEKGYTVWKAETSGAGDGLSSFKKLLELTCTDVIKDLKSKGLLK